MTEPPVSAPETAGRGVKPARRRVPLWQMLLLLVGCEAAALGLSRWDLGEWRWSLALPASVVAAFTVIGWLRQPRDHS